MDIIKNSYVNNESPLYIGIGAVLLTAIYYYFKNRSLPPGPIGLPYFGFWPFWNDKALHLHLQELGKKYGDVFSFTVFGRLYINIGSAKALREAHVTNFDCFSDRPEGFTMTNMCFQDGIVFVNGEKWKVLRKFFGQQLRERGFNSLKNDGDTIYETIDSTIEDLRKSGGEPVDLIDMLTDKCTKIFYTMLFSERGIREQEIRELNIAFGELFENLFGKIFLLCGNVARWIVLPFMQRYWNARRYYNVMTKKLYEIINRHKETFDEDHIRNIIDAFLQERRIRMSKEDPTADYFTDKALMSSLFQMVGDGVISVAGLIASFIHTLADRPEEQDKIYKELIDVIGPDRDPRLEDKSKLTYTNAFISELIRTSDLIPFFPDMECTKEVYLRGYRIPKGAITLMNSWSCHQDPNEYEDPDKFNPSRFIQGEGKKKVEPTVLFGMGKRACIGEGFVMSQIFIFLTTIVKHFHLSKPRNSKEGIMFLGKSIRACATPRTEYKN